jgi:NitT/TauT family transport system substrate-binding protein
MEASRAARRVAPRLPEPSMPFRSLLVRALVAGACLLALGAARADDKVTVITNWFAQAEHGGIYQALATGLYQKAGLDVTVKQGGPQVNAIQLLAADQADFIMNRDFAVLQAVARGVPLVTVLAPTQYDAQGMLTHDDVTSLAGLKDKTILIAGTANLYWWPWLKKKYGYTDAQTRPYTGNLQPFMADPNIAQQAFPTAEPYQLQQKGVKYRFFPFAAEGYPPYHGAIVTLQKTIDAKPDMVARFVRATAEGWKSFLADPAPAAAIMKRDNPAMTDGEIAFAVQKLKEGGSITGGDAAKLGIGIMTAARWKKTFDFMVESGLIAPTVDWHKAYTTRFVDDLKVMP